MSCLPVRPLPSCRATLTRASPQPAAVPTCPLRPPTPPQTTPANTPPGSYDRSGESEALIPRQVSLLLPPPRVAAGLARPLPQPPPPSFPPRCTRDERRA
mmetsp:Transcript_40125/g.106130  ORF Transcript_40125/g.106130 Transcript_40125/m.106130 type:complete len:100 (+) Transcript_40125:264-563(+)